MSDTNAPAAAKSSTARIDPLHVLAWVEEDRLLLKDRTRHGLHRRVIARKGGMPSAEVWVAAVSIADGIERERISFRYAERDRFWFLWITWKDKTQ